MTVTEWRHLSSLESALVEQLLAPDFSGKDELIRQSADALAVTIDSDGSVRFRLGPSPPASTIRSRVPTEGEFQDSDAVTVHVLLHVVDGYMHELEIYKEDGSQVLDWSQATCMKVFALGGDSGGWPR